MRHECGFAEALSRLDDKDGDLKAVALLRSGVLEQMANRLNDGLHILRTAAPLFEASANHTLKGRFHNELAMVLKDLGAIENRTDYIDRALIEFTAASFHFDEAGHARYQACVENNLGFLFGTIGKFVKAHEHLDRAQALFTRLNDSVHLAQVEDTRARVMLAEGAVAKAEKIARAAVQMLEPGGILVSSAVLGLITLGITTSTAPAMLFALDLLAKSSSAQRAALTRLPRPAYQLR